MKPLNQMNASRLICESKITLKILPWLKYDAHERIYNATLNGAVCVSDASEYLMEHFENGKNIVFYELDKLGDLEKMSGLCWIIQDLQGILSKIRKIKLRIPRGETGWIISWNKNLRKG